MLAAKQAVIGRPEWLRKTSCKIHDSRLYLFGLMLETLLPLLCASGDFNTRTTYKPLQYYGFQIQERQVISTENC